MADDCTFELLFASDLAQEHEAVDACVLVDHGQEFSCLDVEASWVTTGIGKQI